MTRIGIDVGGTNTDAVLLADGRVAHSVKTPTTPDVTSGIAGALRLLLEASSVECGRVDAVMIGTTHFTNAVAQRRDLEPWRPSGSASRRAPRSRRSSTGRRTWPGSCGARSSCWRAATRWTAGRSSRSTRRACGGSRGGSGRAALRAVAVASVFSPLNPACEEQAAGILREECPDVAVTLPHHPGRIGLLERENAAGLNAALTGLARRTTRAFTDALARSGLAAPLYLTPNDGTVTRAPVAEAFPVFAFASGPTNSMRGAAFLSGLRDALVVDVGGTTTDVGALRHGFPREANAVVEVGGVRTLFRMPDVLSLPLGGGTLVGTGDAPAIGPESVGYRVTERALVFGAGDLTCTDVAVAAGLADLGDRARVAGVPAARIRGALARLRTRSKSA